MAGPGFGILFETEDFGGVGVSGCFVIASYRAGNSLGATECRIPRSTTQVPDPGPVPAAARRSAPRSHHQQRALRRQPPRLQLRRACSSPASSLFSLIYFSCCTVRVFASCSGAHRESVFRCLPPVPFAYALFFNSSLMISDDLSRGVGGGEDETPAGDLFSDFLVRKQKCRYSCIIHFQYIVFNTYYQFMKNIGYSDISKKSRHRTFPPTQL